MVRKYELKKRESKAPQIERTRDSLTYIPNVDIYEGENEIILKADMPGVDEKSVEVRLDDNILTIKGKVENNDYKDYQLVYSEYSPGDYERTFRISDEIDVNKIEARIKNGVLTVTLPKSEEVKPKLIKVKTE